MAGTTRAFFGMRTWAQQTAAPTVFDITGSYERRGTGTTYPTETSATATSQSPLTVGKTYAASVWRRRRGAAHKPGGAEKIPSGIVTATWNASQIAKAMGEAFGTFNIYLLGDGVDITDTASYADFTRLLASVASADISDFPVNQDIALDASVLNANAGNDLILLFTTATEEAGLGSGTVNSYVQFFANTITMTY